MRTREEIFKEMISDYAYYVNNTKPSSVEREYFVGRIAGLKWVLELDE
jgi:hypothetical protein